MKYWIILAAFLNVLQILNAGPEHELLFTIDDKIAFYDVSIRNFTSIINGLPGVAGIDFDYETQMVFYVRNKREIYSLSLITKEIKIVLILAEKANVQQIAVDWITKKIYFTDLETKRIEVCKFDGSDRHVLFSKNILSNPQGVAVSPLDGLLFYTDWGEDPRLERVNMDGSGRRALVKDNLLMPTVVTVDRSNKSVLWFDVYKSAIEIIQMDGTNRRKVSSAEELSVFDMTILGSRLYYSDWNTNMSSSCNLLNTSLSLCQNELNGMGYSSLRAYGKQYQPFMHSGCHIKNGGCSHLCLLKANGQSCACPTGLKLLKDNKTCATSMEKFIILASKKNLRIISLDVEVAIDQMLPLKIDHIINTMDYDPVGNMLYWTDGSASDPSVNTGFILRSPLNGSAIDPVIKRGYTLPDTPAIDWIARNLYWTCPEFNKIYVSKLDGSGSTVIVDTGLEEPRGIAVDPTDGRLYWSDWGKSNPKIEASDLDGKNRVVLINDGLIWPNGIALDYLRRHLYWVDAGLNSIEFYDLDLKTRHKLEAGSPHPYSISVLGNYVYWTDWQKRFLYQMDLVTREEKVVTVVADIMGVKAIDTTFQYGNNSCQNNNNGCSHFCFYKHNRQVICGCPDGYQLDNAKKSCAAITGYLFYSTQTSINMLSLDPEKKPPVPEILDAEITHLSTHPRSRLVYWVDNYKGGPTAKAIKSVPLNDTDSVAIVQTGFYGTIGGIVVDWIGENIYWSQQNLNRIEVSKLDGRYRRSLLHTKFSLGLISVNPLMRKLYWFEIHGKYSLLYKSNLYGDSQLMLANVTGIPSGLAVDVNSSRIYWVAKHTQNSIESIKCDGTDRHVIATSLGTPIGLTVFRDRLYFGEQENLRMVKSSISSINKYTGKDKIVVKDKTDGAWIQSIAAFHESLQIGENICEKENGGCEHLCFATSLTQRTCQCEMHYTLNPKDNASCIAPELFILLSEESVIYRVPLEENIPEVPFHIPSFIDIRNIDYNINANTIFWLDPTTFIIHYLTEKLLVKTVHLGIQNAKPESFVIDFFTNSLFWSDSVLHTIGYVSLDDFSKFGIIFSNQEYHPTKLAILPEQGLIYFVNEHRSNTGRGFDSIHSIGYDGMLPKRLHRFQEPSHSPRGRYDITVDYQAERLFWLHLSQKKICSIDGKGQGDVQVVMEFNKKLYDPVTISVHGSFLYWVDADKTNHIEKLKKRKVHDSLENKRNKISHFNRRYENVMDLIMVDLKRKQNAHPCKLNNGGCSHICFIAWLKDDVSEARCACPHGYSFQKNNRTYCTKRDTKTCPNICNGECHPSSVLCEELEHCKDGIQDCMCRPDEFRCPSRKCIPYNAMCDGKFDCVNGEDEDVKECEKYYNLTLTDAPTTTPTILAEHPDSDYSTYTAGIISGAIITSLIFVCVLYIVCIHHHKKSRLLNKQEVIAMLEKSADTYETGTNSVVILQPKDKINIRRPTESLLESTTTLSRKNFDIDMRYITGSSVGAADSVMLPLNPPPSIMSAPSVLTRSSLTLDMDSISQINNDDLNSNYYTDCELPAPPATPVYVPSDVESIATYRTNTYLQKQQRFRQQCIYCRKQLSAYNDLPSNRENIGLCCERTAPSLASSYASYRRKQLLNRNSYYSSLDSLKQPSLTRQLSYLTSIADSVHSQDGRLLPSLASEASLSRYPSHASIATVRELKRVDYDSGDSSGRYAMYAPPPSPGNDLTSDSDDSTRSLDDFTPTIDDFTPTICEFSPDMNDFTEFKDEEEEAREVDFLLDSHRRNVDGELF